jgi:hypothetical protein
MGVAVLDRQRQLGLDWAAPEDRLLPTDRQPRMRHSEAVDHGALTLDDLITGAWEGLSVCRTTSCPVCGGRMASLADPPQEVWSGGDCADCGARLS